MASTDYKNTTFFAPHLAIRVLRPAMEFYQKAFGATVLQTWEHEGRVHVAEMELSGCLFHLHEETPRSRQMSPETLNGTSLVIGLFTPDPDNFSSKRWRPVALLIVRCRIMTMVIVREPSSTLSDISG